MATFFSKHRELKVNLGVKVTKMGDKEVSNPITASFKDNMFRTEDKELIELLRKHPFFKTNLTGGFHETDEKSDRETLLQAKKIQEQGTKIDLGARTQAAAR